MASHRLILALALLLAESVAAAPPERAEASGTEARPATAAGAAAAASRAPSRAGLRAFRDPATGALVEQPVTDAQRRLLEQWRLEAREKSAAGLEVVRLRDGSLMVDVRGHVLHYSVAARAADGALVAGCSGAPAVPDLRGLIAARRAADADAQR